MANKNNTASAEEIIETVEEALAETEAKAVEGEAPQNTEPERVSLHIPKNTADNEPNFYIGINGVNYVLPKGKTSMVPPEVKAEYERAVRAQEKMDEHIDEMLEAASASK